MGGFLMELDALKQILSAVKELGVKRIRIADMEAEFFKESTIADVDFSQPVSANKEPVMTEEDMLFWSTETDSQDSNK